MVKINKKADFIYKYLTITFPDAKCFLNYSKDYELVIAVMLSAQTTDKAVNKVTDVLFKKYESLQELANADIVDVENCIKSLGLYKNKAKNIIGISKKLIDDFNGVVPDNKNDLMKLPGVGNKTANVVLIELFKKEEFPVDTHINRIAKRLGIAEDFDDISVVEDKLKSFFKNYSYINLHHQIILFGRNICNAKNPKCQNCGLKTICKYHEKLNS